MDKPFVVTDAGDRLFEGDRLHEKVETKEEKQNTQRHWTILKIHGPDCCDLKHIKTGMKLVDGEVRRKVILSSDPIDYYYWKL